MAYTTINKSSDFFKTKTFTGTGSNQSITGIGFQPDFLWGKNREKNTTYTDHVLVDVIRGSTKRIYSNKTDAESVGLTGVISFDTDGFTVGTGTNLNNNTDDIVAWNWKAGTAVSGSTTGSGTAKTYTGSVNTTSGFSIIKYTGNGTAGHTIPHHLGAVPKMMMVKELTSADDWIIYHVNQGNNKAAILNNDDGFGASNTYWNDTTPTSSSFTVNGNQTNENTKSYIAYIFTDIQGYSKFSNYYGNNNANGTFCYLGYKPSFIMLKYQEGSGQGGWVIFDSERNGYNANNPNLIANTDAAEDAGNPIDILSNGFKIRNADVSCNRAGYNYVYMAFAKAPLVGSNNVPCTAR